MIRPLNDQGAFNTGNGEGHQERQEKCTRQQRAPVFGLGAGGYPGTAPATMVPLGNHVVLPQQETPHPCHSPTHRPTVRVKYTALRSAIASINRHQPGLKIGSGDLVRMRKAAVPVE